MKTDVLVIGAGISGLTAASLLAKSGLDVVVVDKSNDPGGTCGIFKRRGRIFDQGSSMLYGFGDSGFNSHRFVFNVLEEPITVVEQNMLYVVNFKGHRVHFHKDIDKFIDELSLVFPDEKDNIKRFYKDMSKLYKDVLEDTPSYTTPDEINRKDAMENFKKHPFSYIKFLSFLNKSAKSLLQKYFKNPEIFNFFDKMTSTYCYATVEEAPAILAAVMFVDNHKGGSFYPAGSSLFLPGKLEKVIEENNGTMIQNREVEEILFKDNKATGVLLDTGDVIEANEVIYTGTVWNLYDKLISKSLQNKSEADRLSSQIPTHPSVVLYALLNKEAISEDAQPIEMLIGDPEKIDEREVTCYIYSLSDKTICEDDEHVLVAIGPSFKNWDVDDEKYKSMKKDEIDRLVNVISKRFPNLKKNIKHVEVSTPRTIERYTLKNKGSVAGPKQMLGQHMFKRQHIRTDFENLFCGGESTIMGTGTPTVTVSGIACANAILKKKSLPIYKYKENMKDFVKIVSPPASIEDVFSSDDKNSNLQLMSNRCWYCLKPNCSKNVNTDIRGIMRRTTVGNFYGAYKKYRENPLNEDQLKSCEKNCILKDSIEIEKIIKELERIYEDR